MIKKIALTILLISTLVRAETSEKGFLLGLNLGKHDSESEYKQVGTATNNHIVSSSEVSLVPKIGYQYYFTRVYFLANKYNYKEARDRYSIKGVNYEINVDYIPRIYRGEETSVHLLAGISLGMQKSTLQNVSQKEFLLPVEPATPYEYTQKNFNHGYKIGVLLSFYKRAVSVEAGFKTRTGTLLEFQDDKQGTNRATFTLDSKESFVGLNYLF